MGFEIKYCAPIISTGPVIYMYISIGNGVQDRKQHIIQNVCMVPFIIKNLICTWPNSLHALRSGYSKHFEGLMYLTKIVKRNFFYVKMVK